MHSPPTQWSIAHLLLLTGVLCLIHEPIVRAAETTGTLGYNRDIRPILSDHCFACHGPDATQRKGGLRLDQRQEALRPAKSGRPAIVPGRPDESRLLEKIHAKESDDLMPPTETQKPLTDRQKELLRRWVVEGARYESHWAFALPSRPKPPPVRKRRWTRNEIDSFILARLADEGLSPSPEADRSTLIRRLSLDLTGLPPSPGEIDMFLSDRSPKAYERVVDRLLGSVHYGERMAVDWLDAARFADTNGYQVDRDREAYGWRDWVIQAFNSNKPFDVFTLEQLAGDLLPNASLDQRIATGFHRNHMVNEEGGIIPEEFLAEYCADRVETTATVWLAQTFNCTRCHDHKFDPFTQRDFYGLYAFFHNVTEKGVGDYSANIRRNNPPFLQLPAPEAEARLARIKRDHADTQRQAQALSAALAASQPAWEDRVLRTSIPWAQALLKSALLNSNALGIAKDGMRLTVPPLPKGRHALSLTLSPNTSNATALRIDLSHSNLAVGGITIPLTAISLRRRTAIAPEGIQTNWTLHAAEVPGSIPTTEAAIALDLKAKQSVKLTAAQNTASPLIYRLEPTTNTASLPLQLDFIVPTDSDIPAIDITLSFTDVPPEQLPPNSVRSTLAKEKAHRTPEEVKQLTDFRLAMSVENVLLSRRLDLLSRQIDVADLQIPTALVMQEMAAPRPTHILIRGAYDRKGATVTAQTPASLPSMAEELPRNRLGLARWLTDPANPLTARVAVNRFWQSLYGVGLVATSEDFGTKGEPPSHPELLDWLAAEFVSSGWDVKALMRLLVTSATYRQSSRLTPELRARDPQNRLLARGPRFRLQAEFVRDQALAAAGLLVRKIGGPSVKPYHPPGLYEQVVAGSSASSYVEGQGDDLHRRSLYTYWKRSVPNPAMLLFDAPFRESCTVRRPRTNTPLQALNLLNDPTFLEAARGLAQRAMHEGGDRADTRLSYAFRLATCRPPREAELSVLRKALARSLGEFSRDAETARQLLKIGATAPDPSLDPVQLAAFTTVASTLLNLDEVLTKE